MTKEEINQFFLDNRTKSADTVNSIYNDPKYASTIFNSSVPLPQLEKNIKQSKGATLEPYDPSWTETARYDLAEGVKNLGVPNYPAQKFARGMYGDRNAERMIDQFGFLDVAQMFVPSLIPPMMMLYGNEAYRGFDKAINKEEQDWTDYISPVMDSVGLGVQGYFVGKSLKEPVKNFFQSVKNKFTKTPKSSFKTTDADFGALQNLIEANETKKLSGPTIYNQNKVLANTANKQPSMAITDPKVVDDLGFYSEAERQTKLLQQNKGGGEQFKGMLLNKGVKADELDELGLIELFKQPKVTKQEILDTIELNKVQLIETKKTKTKSDSPDADNLFDMENFTDISKEDGTFFTTADETKDALNTGKYTRRTVTYDGIVDGFEMPLSGIVNTHLPTGYRTVEIGSVDDGADQFIYDIHLTFKPDADVSDWRNSVEAEQYVNDINAEIGFDGFSGMGGQTKLAETKNLQLNDFDTIIQEKTATSYDEAIVRLQSAATNSGDYDPGSFVRWEGSTQPGGTNYKEFLLRLPPRGGRKEYNKPIDFQSRAHFDEFNPLFHIRTKDRTTPDGKKVLYVEELQSDWGQQGRNKGFKLEGEDLENAKKELEDVKQEILDLKKGGVELDGYEQEALYKLAYPNRPPIRIPFKKPEDLARVDQGNEQSYYATDGTFKKYEFDYSASRMPEELKTMTFGQYMNFYEVMGRMTKGNLQDPFNPKGARVASVLDPQDSINRYYDDKPADYIASQINQPSFASDGNTFLNKLSNKFIKKSNNIQGRIPTAPFVKDTEKWTGLAMKRLIKLAEEGGYDHIAFSPGNVQYQRWNEQGLVEYYDQIIPSVAQDVTRKMSDKSSNMKTTTRDLEVVINNNFQNDVVDPTYSQKTFAINITPKVRDTARSGQAMFSLAAGLTAGASALSNQDVGALGSLPNDGT